MRSILLTAVLTFVITLNACTDKNAEYRSQFKPECDAPVRHISDGVMFSPAQFDGMRLFMKFCNKCHPGGEKGKGPSLNDKNLPNFLIHTQVRVGFGKMPDFDKDQISKDELDKIVAFVSMMHDIHADLENMEKARK